MKKILIVDDSGLSRNILKKLIGVGSIEFLEASEGFAALELFSVHQPDLVTLDLNMSGMNGYEVLENFRKINPATPIIVCSADIQQGTRDLVLKMGAKGFISKPFKQDDISNMIDQFIK